MNTDFEDIMPDEYYPTPNNIIYKMIADLDFKMIKYILEPSAGTGNIVDILKEKENTKKYSYDKYNFNIDCIEIDNNFKHILNGKGYRVIHDDFLTFKTMKEYDLIIMNPPFSNGCKHLLKALKMQERNGGAVVSILNAETLKNAYTNERKELLNKLNDYNATIEYIQDGFINAGRKTGVEIALIKVQLPEVKRQSFILDNLKKKNYDENIYTDENTQLVDSDYFNAIVNQYNLELNAGINLIKEYYAMRPFILSEFGKDKETGEIIQVGGCILSLGITSNNDRYNNNLSINNYIKDVRRKYWKALFDNKDFVGKLTNNLRQDFYSRIDDLVDYDFSIYNINQIKLDMQNKVVDGIKDTIIALFDEFSHKHYYYDETSKNIHFYNGWKTNKSWIVNSKVIIPLNAYDTYYIDKFNPTKYDVIRKIEDMEKCFNYLDNGLTENIDLKAALDFAEEYGETKNIELKYFNVTFYKKGTCHITFTNSELLKKFNIFGSQSKGWLPPSYGKKTYTEMNEEEKSVILNFEGEKSYNETLDNANYYIINNKSLYQICCS